MKKEFQPIKKLIEGADKILITGHRNPDGDSIGSVLALKTILQGLGKNTTAISSESLPVQYNFLPNVWQVKPPHLLLGSGGEQREDALSFDLIFCLDYGSPERIDLPRPFPSRKGRGFADFFPYQSKIITIDHHLPEKQIGQLKLIDSKASSTCEILFGLFEDFGWRITKDIAVCLLTGIITDTESFRTPNASPSTLRVASQLLSRAGSLSKIIKHAFATDFKTLRLWGQILNKIALDKKIGLIMATLSYQDSQKINLKEQDLSGFPNFLNLVDEARVSLVLLEKEPQKIKGSLRSKNLNVATLAEKLGGGGHKLAAGFETEGEIEDIVETIKKELTR